MIHPSAIIAKTAKLAESIEIGPFSIIGPQVKIGPQVSIASSCIIEGDTVIGRGCKIFTAAVIGTAPQDLKYKGEDTKLEIGQNNIIREYATINRGTLESGITRVGDNNLIMAYSHIAHDCVIGNDCVLANCATLAGHVTIEDKAVIGGLVAIHQFVRVGKLSIIGGCSKVVQDIPPFSTCDGHPAKVFGLNLVGLRRAELPRGTAASLKAAFKYFFFSGLTAANAFKKVQNEIPPNPEITYLLDFMQSSSRGVTRAARTSSENI